MLKSLHNSLIIRNFAPVNDAMSSLLRENLKDNAVLVMSIRLKYRVMNQIIKKVSLSLMALLLVSTTVSAESHAYKSKSGFNWNPVMEAIIQVESEGNPNAVSGNSVGVMQITPILVKDCNQILKKKKSKKRYTMTDRYSVAKSKEMFLLIQNYYNPEKNLEKAIRLWNGGVKYSIRATNGYYKKVLAQLK